MSIDEVETTIDGRKPQKTKSIGACTYRVFKDVEGSLHCNVMTRTATWSMASRAAVRRI